MKAIERESNYVHPHGAYVENWFTPSSARIWSYLAPLPQEAVHTLLATAFVAQEGDPHANLRGLLPDGDYGHWLRVGNKNFVIYYVDYNKVYAITNRDGRYFLICAKLQEVEAYIKSSRDYYSSYPRMKKALQNLWYDLNAPRDLLL